MRAIKLLLCGGMLVTGVIAVALSRMASQELTLELQRKSIRELDPLFVRVVISNPWWSAISRPRNFTEFDGGLHLELWSHVEQRYIRLRPAVSGSGCNWAPPGSPPTLVAPGQRYVSYEVLRGWDMGAGVFELRATALVGGRKISSAPLNLEVASISIDERIRIQDLSMVASPGTGLTLSSFLDEHIGLRVPSRSATIERLAAIEKVVTESNLKGTLRLILAIRAIRDTDTPEAMGRSIANVGEMYAALDPVMSEVADVMMAQQYVEMKKWDEAERHLNRLPAPSNRREALEELIREGRGMH